MDEDSASRDDQDDRKPEKTISIMERMDGQDCVLIMGSGMNRDWDFGCNPYGLRGKSHVRRV